MELTPDPTPQPIVTAPPVSNVSPEPITDIFSTFQPTAATHAPVTVTPMPATPHPTVNADSPPAFAPISGVLVTSSECTLEMVEEEIEEGEFEFVDDKGKKKDKKCKDLPKEMGKDNPNFTCETTGVNEACQCTCLSLGTSPTLPSEPVPEPATTPPGPALEPETDEGPVPTLTGPEPISGPGGPGDFECDDNKDAVLDGKAGTCLELMYLKKENDRDDMCQNPNVRSQCRGTYCYAIIG
jgi:hypothetical protein